MRLFPLPNDSAWRASGPCTLAVCTYSAHAVLYLSARFLLSQQLENYGLPRPTWRPECSLLPLLTDYLTGVMPTCEHLDVCGRDALDGHDGKCILHSAKPDKDEEAFKKALGKHREGHGDNFQGMVFPKRIDSSGQSFKSDVKFQNATFRGEVDFDKADFEWVSFHRATFEDEAYFTGTAFREAIFTDATFEKKAFFSRAFRNRDGVEFDEAKFTSCKFRGGAKFTGKDEKNRAFSGGKVSFQKVTVPPDADFHFRYADLSRCRFLRTDLQNADFIGVQWCEEVSDDEWTHRTGLYDEVEESHKCSSPDDASDEAVERRRSFGDILWTTIDRMGSPHSPHWTLFEIRRRPEGKWREVERLYRQLKRNYEERGDFPRGGDFHIGEKEARRRSPETSGTLKFLLYTYRALSKYGERALPAVFWLVAAVLSFALLYHLSGATTLATTGEVTYSGALIYSLEATLYPVESVGFLGFWPQFFSIVQRVVSPVLIALLALALRQRVKR